MEVNDASWVTALARIDLTMQGYKTDVLAAPVS